MELSMERGQLLNNLTTSIENIIKEKTDFISKLNIANNNEDPIEFVAVLESFEKIDITKCFEINEILENLIAIYNNELNIDKKIELIKSFIKIIPNIELSKVNVISFYIKLHLQDEKNDMEAYINEQTIIDNVNYFNCSNSLIKEIISYYYKSIDNDSFTFLNGIFENDENGNNKFNEFNSKVLFDFTQTFLILQKYKRNNSNLSNSTQITIKKCNAMNMELLQLHIGNLSGNYMNALCDYNNSSLLYKNYGHVCDLLISLCNISSNDFKLLNLSWKFLVRISCSEKLVDNISKYFKLNQPIDNCYENIKTYFDKVVESILDNDIKKDQLKRNIVLIRFYFTHFHSLYIKHSNYISLYSIDESYPLFKTFINLYLYIKYRLSVLFFKYHTFNEEQVSALAKLNDAAVAIDKIFSHYYSSESLNDTQKLNYIIYLIRFSYVDVNIDESYEKILTSDNFYFTKLIPFDEIFRHFWQLSDSIQRSLLNDSTQIDDVVTDNSNSEGGNTIPNILYSYFNYIDKCPSDLLRHQIPGDSDDSDEMSTFDKTIIITLSLLPHYIHHSLFSYWEKYYFSILIHYQNQILQTILVESWCNIFKYFNNDIQINEIKQLYQLLVLLKDTSAQDPIKTILFKLIRINTLNNNNNYIIKELFSLTSSKDICSAEIEQKFSILNMLNTNDLYYRDDQIYKTALNIWENVLCPLLEHPDEKIALSAFKKCSLPIKIMQKYLDNNGILSLSPQEIKKLQDVSIVLLGNCKTAIQADLKESSEEDEKLNAYLTFKTLESLIDISISLVTEYTPENVIKILEIIDNWHFKVPYLKYELIPHVSIINFLSSCGKVDFTEKNINKASELLELLYHTYFNSSNWVLKHQAFLSITQFGVTTIHSEILKKIVTEPYQQQFINIVSGVPIFEQNKNININYKEENKNEYVTILKDYKKYLEKELETIDSKLKPKDDSEKMQIDDFKNENNQNIANKVSLSNTKDLNHQSTEIQKCIYSLKECIKNLEQIRDNTNKNNSEIISNNEIFSLKLYVDNINDAIKKQLNKN